MNKHLDLRQVGAILGLPLYVDLASIPEDEKDVRSQKEYEARIVIEHVLGDYRYSKTEIHEVLNKIAFECTHNWSSRGSEKYITVDRLEEIIKESRREINEAN